jgi:hypothetical protein
MQGLEGVDRLDSVYTLTRLYQAVANELLSVDGIVFGGYVRDTITRDHAIGLFKSKYAEDDPRFFDPIFDRASLDRLMIPSCIECLIAHRDYNACLAALKLHGFLAEETSVRPASIGIPLMSHKTNVRMMDVLIPACARQVITPRLFACLTCKESIVVDFIVCPQPGIKVSPSMIEDSHFQCDSLILTKFGVSALDADVRLNDIITDIRGKRAVIKKASMSRTFDLMRMGYDIVFPATFFV